MVRATGGAPALLTNAEPLRSRSPSPLEPPDDDRRVSWPLDDRLVQYAISGILDRSERQEDLDQLEATFVDPGIALRLHNNNNQIVYGRRGTGKTHVLKVLLQKAASARNELPVYIDMRTVGSDRIWEDADRPSFLRVANLLRDVLSVIQTALLEHATRPDNEPPGAVFESLDELSRAMTRSFLSSEKVVAEEVVSADASSGAKLEVDIALPPRIRVGGDDSSTRSKTLRILQEGQPLERILFRDIGDSLQRTVAHAGIRRLLVLIDEWTAVPADLQPLLAEFLKRSFIPHPRITVKLGAIEHRTCLGVPLALNNTLGFERSADVGAALSLDDFFVYDMDEQRALELFAEVVFLHLAVQSDNHWLDGTVRAGGRLARAPRDLARKFAARRHEDPGYYLRDGFGVTNGDEFVSAFFDTPEAFIELARAGQGVARDFMYLFQQAAFDTLRRRKVRIDISSVRHAAREHYALEKVAKLDDHQRAVLSRIVSEVVGRQKARSFMFAEDAEQHEVVRALFDRCLIHLVKRGFIPPDEDVGTQYSVYTLDYGAYVDLLGTDRAPRGDFSREHGDNAPTVSPFGDGRAIKKIVLAPELLEV